MAGYSLVSMGNTPQGNGAMDGPNGQGGVSPAAGSKAAQKQVLRALAVARIRQRAGMGQPSAMSPAGFGNPTDGKAAQAYQHMAPALQVGGGA